MPLIKQNWEKDIVYLIQFPRCGCIPSSSPFSLKLETWLRMAGINYVNISNEFKHLSSRGQQPFIELNGEQISDSSIIIEKLAEHFGGVGRELEALIPSEKSVSRGFYILIEHHLTWLTFYSRSKNFKWIGTDAGYNRLVGGVKGFFLKNLVVPNFERKLRAKCDGQWIGTLTDEERIEQIKKDIDAISGQLSDKKYLLGDTLKTIDATLFGHLAQILYTPQFTAQIKEHIELRHPNLIVYFDRIKSQFWPDWDEILETLRMDTQWNN